MLFTYRATLPTQGLERLAVSVAAAFRKAVRSVPGVAHVEGDAVPPVLDRMLTLSRVAVTFDGAPLDRALLIEAVDRLAVDDEASAALRGVAADKLFDERLAKHVGAHPLLLGAAEAPGLGAVRQLFDAERMGREVH